MLSDPQSRHALLDMNARLSSVHPEARRTFDLQLLGPTTGRLCRLCRAVRAGELTARRPQPGTHARPLWLVTTRISPATAPAALTAPGGPAVAPSSPTAGPLRRPVQYCHTW